MYCKERVDRDEAIRQGVVSFCSDEHRKAWWDDQRTKRRVQTIRNLEANRPSRPPKASRSHPKGRLRPRSGVRAETRRDVFIKDDWKCRFCRRSSVALQCHHVIYRSEAPNAPWLHEASNLITLCSRCHDKVHSDKKRWQSLCLGVVWIREVEGDRWCTIPSLEIRLHNTQRRGDGNNQQQADPD